MKNHVDILKRKSVLIFSLVFILAGCTQMSEKETDTLAGLNGGFEISQNALPVNWLMYTPNTVPNADFEIKLDRNVYKEGEQSLRFDVKKCSATGGWYSPGFTNEFSEVGGFEGPSIYKLSFWIKNDGTEYKISSGGVSPFEGEMKVLVKSDEPIEDWKLHEFEVRVPQDRHLRLELNILQAGTFWIDDLQIEKLTTSAANS